MILKLIVYKENLRKERRQETKIPFNLNFIFGFNDYSVSGKFYQKPIKIFDCLGFMAYKPLLVI